MKLVWTVLITVVLSFDCMGLNLMARANRQQLSEDELKAARQLAVEFTKGFVRTTDLAPLIKDYFAKDFIQRYTKAKLKDLRIDHSFDLYFVPGLDYNSRLLAEASAEDWLRFYTAANNFLFFGTVSAIKNSRNAAEITATQLYPASVINLLNTNPTLSNMIVRKGSSRGVGSVAEMQKATAILEQAVSLMRRQTDGRAPLNIDEQELIKAMQEDEFFRPKVETMKDQFFGLPQGTRIVFINTPILFRLMLVKANNNSWEILWADPLVT